MAARIAYLSPNSEQMEHFERLAAGGEEIVWVDSNQPVEKQAEDLRGVVAVIPTPSRYPEELAKLTPSVRLVQTISAGTNMIDKVALGELGILVANNGGGNAIAVAEHTIALMVSAFRKFQLQFNNVKEGNWSGDIRANWFSQAYEIAGKKIGIVGLGRIGSRLARRLQGWECDLIYSDIIDIDPALEEELHVTRVSLDELLATSDIVSLHVPLNRNTHHMISDREFDMMKPTSLLVNACRGPVVDEEALYRAIRDKKIAVAALDVTEEEPTPVDNPLLQFDNVLITPHLAALAIESHERSRVFAVYNTQRVARGEEPESVVPPDD